MKREYFNTKPEILVRKFLFSHGFRYRLHDKKLAGKPDIVLPKYKTVIFVNGCFWHGHENCQYFCIPKTRSTWWEEKISRNVAKFNSDTKSLQESGWKVLTLWTCQLRPKKREDCLRDLIEFILRI